MGLRGRGSVHTELAPCWTGHNPVARTEQDDDFSRGCFALGEIVGFGPSTVRFGECFRFPAYTFWVLFGKGPQKEKKR